MISAVSLRFPVVDVSAVAAPIQILMHFNFMASVVALFETF